MFDWSQLMQFAPQAASSAPAGGSFPSMGNMNAGSSTLAEQSMANNAARLGTSFSNSFSGAAGNPGTAPMVSQSGVQPAAQFQPALSMVRPEASPSVGNSGGSQIGYSDLMALLSRFGRR